jgi:hypothetical protein
LEGRLREYKENSWGPGTDNVRRWGPMHEYDWGPFPPAPEWTPSREERINPELGEDRTLKRTLEQRLLDPARRGIPGGPANKQELIDAKRREATRQLLARTAGVAGDKIVGGPGSSPFSPTVPMPHMLRDEYDWQMWFLSQRPDIAKRAEEGTLTPEDLELYKAWRYDMSLPRESRRKGVI